MREPPAAGPWTTASSRGAGARTPSRSPDEERACGRPSELIHRTRPREAGPTREPGRQSPGARERGSRDGGTSPRPRRVPPGGGQRREVEPGRASRRPRARRGGQSSSARNMAATDDGRSCLPRWLIRTRSLAGRCYF